MGPVQSGRSWVKLDGPNDQKWTVQKTKSGQSEKELDVIKEGN